MSEWVPVRLRDLPALVGTFSGLILTPALALISAWRHDAIMMAVECGLAAFSWGSIVWFALTPNERGGRRRLRDATK